ncbi:uncharacterized oxidoreductase SSP1627-like [Colletes gigas]|nr:uncharacterized oxidoreductase SSP1627-like [Colletes gigas]
MNGKLLSYSSEIRNAVLVIHGENAHSRYFGEDAFKTLKGDNKKLMIIPGASHTDLKIEMIKDKVVIITGASSGIGEATAKLLVEQGAKVVLGARREERLKELADKLGPNVSYKKTDVSKFDEVKSLIDYTLEIHGHIDVLYNNAGIMPQGFLREGNLKSYQEMIDINVMGVLNGITAVLPTMRSQKDGLIISTDSVAGHVVYPASAVYNGTKFMVRAIMEGLRQEERESGIRSTIVSPGAVSTELISTVGNSEIEKGLTDLFNGSTDSGMTLLPIDVANAVLYAINQPKHVTVSEVLIRPANQSV